jgi:DNA-binding CsgD family transcriptional regulator
VPTDTDPALRERLQSLSARERDCLRLILENHTSKEVGRRLGISHTSVDTHVRRARAKLGLRDRYDAARLLAQWEALADADGGPAPSAEPAAPATPVLQRGPWSLPPMEELGPWTRIGLVLVCALFIALVFGVVLTALLAL